MISTLANRDPRLTARRTACTLGFAGLLPFVVCSALLWWGPPAALLAAKVLTAYALAILCFLCGSWWGIGLLRGSAAPLLWSNALVVLAVAAFSLLPSRAVAGLLSLGLAFSWWFEGWHPVFRRQPPYYRRLRTALTLVALCALLLALPYLP